MSSKINIIMHHNVIPFMQLEKGLYRHLSARMALMIFKDVLLRTMTA